MAPSDRLDGSFQDLILEQLSDQKVARVYLDTLERKASGVIQASKAPLEHLALQEPQAQALLVLLVYPEREDKRGTRGCRAFPYQGSLE